MLKMLQNDKIDIQSSIFFSINLMSKIDPEFKLPDCCHIGASLTIGWLILILGSDECDKIKSCNNDLH